MYNDHTTKLFGEHTGLSYIILGLPLDIQSGSLCGRPQDSASFAQCVMNHSTMVTSP